MALGKVVVEVMVTYRASCSHNPLVEHNAFALELARRLVLMNVCLSASSYLKCEMPGMLTLLDRGMRAVARTRRREDW